MPLPAKRLKNAPLVHVLAQVVFPPLPHWGERFEALRAALYAEGFIRPAKVQTNEVMFGIAPGMAPSVEQRSGEQDRFVDKDERFAVTCSASTLVLQTTGYQTFPHFLERMTGALHALERTMQVAVVDRIGLRYVDLIQIQDGEHFGLYVHNGLLGFPFKHRPELGVSRVGFSTQSVGLTDIGPLVIRSAVLSPGQLLPPDLETFGLRPPAHVDLARPGLAVDFDHFSLFSGPTAPAPMEFSVNAVLAHFETLHTRVKAAFVAIVLPHAIAAWGGWEDFAE